MEETTVKTIVQNIYELTQARSITTEGRSITLDEFQDLIYQDVDQLANLLGIELEYQPKGSEKTC